MLYYKPGDDRNRWASSFTRCKPPLVKGVKKTKKQLSTKKTSYLVPPFSVAPILSLPFSLLPKQKSKDVLKNIGSRGTFRAKKHRIECFEFD